jgi:hypothetical protein
VSDGSADERPDVDDDEESAASAETPELCFASMLDWFEGWLRPMYRRSTHGDQRDWCAEWWEHEEAVSRLDALWRAWETLRLDPGTGLSVWWRDHADHHMAALLDPDGPFKQCGEEHQGNAPEMLAHTPPPPELFAEAPQAPVAVELGALDAPAGSIRAQAVVARRPTARPELGRSA